MKIHIILHTYKIKEKNHIIILIRCVKVMSVSTSMNDKKVFITLGIEINNKRS